MLREQLIFSCDHELQIWLREHQPKAVEELVNLAEAYQTAHKDSEYKLYQKRQFQYKPIKAVSDEKSQEPGNQADSNQKQGKGQCFICDSTEHLIASCPFKIGRDRTQNEQGKTTRQANTLLYSPEKHTLNICSSKTCCGSNKSHKWT